MSWELLGAFIAAHPLLSLSFVALSAALLGSLLAPLWRGWKEIAPAAAVQLINRAEAVVIDLSPPGDFEKGHILGARNLLPSQLDPAGKELAKLADRPVILVCRTGLSAAQAARRLTRAGFRKVHVLAGGIQGWLQAELPLVRGRR
ncbi:MAG: rhodanese-like domain-containing protein [Xanthomonadales bacterium]|nr:rhodanese-like domain-containing protein [Xanthomonadales bacterium]